jgi:hypothetical protein
MAAPPVDTKYLYKGGTRALVLAWVVTVKAALAALLPAIETVDGTLHVGDEAGEPGAADTAQTRLTTPVKPPEGDTEMVELLPVVAPALIVRLPLLVSVNPGGTAGAVTEAATGVLAVSLRSPEIHSSAER